MGLEGVPILADLSLSSARNLVVGANELDHHLTGVNPGRDFRVEAFRDLAFARAGDPCPECGRPLEVMRGIEVGHVFKLGVKYSEALGANYLDENGKERPIIMGCYGIGIGRTVAAAIEQHHDEEGIIWPMPIAPYQAIVLPLGVHEGSLMERAERLYRELSERGVEVLLDDRNERAGVKFKDADLMGTPIKVIMGPRALKAVVVEIE
ncbi:MAG: His/Gly/Thr/Pro-type tRNA ligase C-terminal domain-containing protein, partial [Nitrospinota bacterium]